MQTLGRPSRHSCERHQSVQFDEAKSLTNRQWWKQDQNQNCKTKTKTKTN